jgi:hypothetical protein
VLNGKIASDTVNLRDDNLLTYVNLKIGSDYTNGGVSYSDHTKIARNDISFTKFTIDYEAAGEKEDDCFIVSLRPNFENSDHVEKNYILFYVIYNNYDRNYLSFGSNEHQGYNGIIQYPYDSERKTIYSNMCNIILRKLVNIYETDEYNNYGFPEDEITTPPHMYCLNNCYKLEEGKTDSLERISDDEIDEKTGKVYYKISTGENKKVDWRMYFIAVPKHFINKEYPTKGIEERTNKHNIILPISISQLIDINQVSRFFPLRITGVRLKYTLGKCDRFKDPDYRSLELFVTNGLDNDNKNTKLAYQQITFHIYYKPVDSNNAVFLCDITQTMLNNYNNISITKFDLDVKQYIPILLPGYNESIHGNTTGEYTGGLCYTYDTKKDGFSSPITFTNPKNFYYNLIVEIRNCNTNQSITYDEKDSTK